MGQWHWEFKDWQEAFKMFYRKRGGERLYDENGKFLGRREGDPTIAFIISTDPYASGYWIEPASGAEPDETTKVYTTVASVKKLERRIRYKIEHTKTVAVGGIVT